jgi:hypothetical protein
MQDLFESIEVYACPNKAARRCRHWWFDIWDWAVNISLRVAGLPQIRVKPGEMAIDPHIHTLFSHCSISQPERILINAARLGLGGVAIMDHHDVKGALDTMRCAEHLKIRGLIPEHFLVIPGVELNSTCGHIGALFVEENLPERLSPEETVRIIHEAGGIAVAPHPYHSTGIGEAIFDTEFDAIEIECGSVFGSRLVKLSQDLAADPRLASVTKLGSSDAHYCNAIAYCYTVLKVQDPSLEVVRQAIIGGHCVPKRSEPYVRMRQLLGRIPKLW